MTENLQAQEVQAEAKTEKEINFERQRKMYERQLQEERKRREDLEQKQREYEQMLARKGVQETDDDDDEPYVDKRKLEKKLEHFSRKTKEETQTEIQKAVQSALAEERRQNWLKNNPDFYEIMQHAERFAQKDPELAETILEMPDSFERQKLVYKNIKALGLHKKEEPRSTIQETVDRNRRSPYYQPSGIGTPGSSSLGLGSKDYSPQEGNEAYKKMQELKNRLRLS